MYNAKHNDIRADQAQEGRARTLTTRPGYAGRSGQVGRKPFVAKGHDAILKEIQDAGGMIIITTLGDGSQHTGTLIARDKFTITIMTTTGGRQTFYKHAIESFEPVASKVQ